MKFLLIALLLTLGSAFSQLEENVKTGLGIKGIQEALASNKCRNGKEHTMSFFNLSEIENGDFYLESPKQDKDYIFSTGDSLFSSFSLFQSSGSEIDDVVVLVEREDNSKALLLYKCPSVHKATPRVLQVNENNVNGFLVNLLVGMANEFNGEDFHSYEGQHIKSFGRRNDSALLKYYAPDSQDTQNSQVKSR